MVTSQDVRVLLARLQEMKQRKMKATWKLSHLSSDSDASGTVKKGDARGTFPAKPSLNVISDVFACVVYASCP